MGMNPSITVIGCDGGALRSAAVAALAGARCVAGTRRHLNAAEVPSSADRIEIGVTAAAPDTVPKAGAFGAALSAILSHPGPVAVLASGDPGFFGIVRALAERGASPTVIPAPSSVAVAFARLGLPWDDALVLSAHGRDPRPVLAAALGCGKAAILTAPAADAGPHRFIPALLQAGRSVYVAQRLGAPDERITEVTAFTGHGLAAFADPNVVVAIDEARAAEASGPRWMAGHLGAPDGWALPEDAFDHRDSMITKAEVRALVLARLGPGPGRTIWDVGAGCGSVAVECARFGAHVIAIESDPAQCARIRANAARHGVAVQVAEAAAPRVFSEPGSAGALLPADAVFVGGGDDAVVGAAARILPARVVVALASVDRVRVVRDLLIGHGYRVEGTAVAAARLAPLPGGSLRLAAANPVFVMSGDRQ